MSPTKRRSPKGSGGIEQMASGRWRLKVPVNGKRVTYGVYETQLEAMTAQVRWVETGLLPSEGGAPALLPVPPPVPRDCCEVWFQRWQTAKKRRSESTLVDRSRGGAPTTLARDQAVWSSRWRGEIGAMYPATVSSADIRRVLRSMESESLAPNTIRTHWITIRAFFNWLVEEKVISTSPTIGIKISVDQVRDRVREIIVPDLTFIDMHTKRLGLRDRVIFELLLSTGGRRSEVAGLRVGDIDFGHMQIKIREPLLTVSGRTVRSTRLKNEDVERTVPMGEDLARLLREYLLFRGRPGPDENLLLGPKGGPLDWQHYHVRQWRPAVASTAVRWAVQERKKLIASGWDREDATKHAVSEAQKLKKMTPHHLRHTAAALLLASGSPEIEVQLILGHRDLKTTKKIYAHLLRGQAGSAARRVEELRRTGLDGAI